MNDTTHYTTEALAGGYQQASSMTQELERLCLLSALKVGLDQLGCKQVVLADEAFFRDAEMRLFGDIKEPIIEA
jgi:hypothetical protein